MHTIRILLGSLLLLAGAQAKLAVNPMFSDGMVLQREMATPVWGTAEPGDSITVSFRDQTKTTKADGSGNWIARLDKLTLGDPGVLTVSVGEEKLSFKDVLVGEVWLGSGQSNMAGGAGGYAKNDPVLAEMIAGGPYPTLRLYRQGRWRIADETSIPAFSALHFSFGRALHEELDVPVGLIVGAAGGTPSGRWLSPEMAAADEALGAQMKANAGFTVEELPKVHEENLAKWKAEAEKLKADGKKPPRFGGPILIGDLFQRFIAPVAPYGIRGVLWDQGESKTQLPGVDQFTTMNALITGWRKLWGHGEFPFLHVQKPSGGGAAWDPENPVNRGAKPFASALPAAPGTNPGALKYQLDHIKIATIPNAPLVIASDLGTGIHPANKSGYGKRASRVALGFVYGHDVAISGPIYKSHAVEGGKVRVSFDHVGQGLAIRHADALQGFAISGADGKWAWADAMIDGETVVLSSADVAEPVHVQYALTRDPNYANLFNKDGLPAQMFTTVEWEK